METQKNQGKPKSFWNKETLHWIIKLCIPCVLIILINIFFIKIVWVSGSSMYPTIDDNDILLINQQCNSIHQGDIVVIKSKEKEISHDYIVKRIIATQGQRVQIDYINNSVYVDGKIVDEYYLNYEQLDPMNAPDIAEKVEYIVPMNCVFVMGDNRNVSLDSRNETIGMIALSDIIGTVTVRIPTGSLFNN